MHQSPPGNRGRDYNGLGREKKFECCNRYSCSVDFFLKKTKQKQIEEEKNNVNFKPGF